MTRPEGPIAHRLRRWLARNGPAGASGHVPLELILGWGEAPRSGHEPLAGQTARACAAAVDRLLADLGIPDCTAPSVILAGPGEAEPYALRVNGRRIRLALGDLDAITADAAGPGTTVEELPAAAVPDVATSVCVAALHRRLSVLLREDHVTQLLLADQAHGINMPLPDLTSVLATVVDNGVSLRNLSEIGHVLTGAQAARPTTQLAELIIDRLRPAWVDLLFSGPTLRRITTADPGRLDLFTGVRTRIFDDTGVQFPDFRFVRDDQMPQERFAFRLNEAITRPRRLRAGEGLAEVAAALEQDLRRSTAWFACLSDLEELVGQLIALPDTVQAVQVRYPRAWLSAVGRAALDEGLSLRQISTLLDWVIDLGPAPVSATDVWLAEGPAPVGLADGDQLPSPRDAVALLRQREREELAWTLPPDGPEYVRRLPAELEDAVEAGRLASDDSVLEKVAATVRALQAEPQPCPIAVSTLAARSRLWEALAPECPGLQVRAEQEYPPSAHLIELPFRSGAAVTSATTG
jgi:hypothetical protein